MTVELEQTLAVFVFDNDKGPKRFLKKLQTIDKADKRVEIVDAAFANRTRLGRVKVHQTRDRGGMKGGIRGGAFGVVVGTIIAGPAGAVVAGAAGAVFAGLRNSFHDIGIDDKFMRRVGKEIDKGRSALFILYQGNWEASIGTIQDAVRAEKGCSSKAPCRPRRLPPSARWSSRPPSSSAARRSSPTTRSTWLASRMT